MRMLALYASTSGSTRSVMDALARDAGPSLTLADITHGERIPPPRDFDLVIAATPTYGRGDAHYAWRERGPQIVRTLPLRQPMALITLGDARGHPRTFAGGLQALCEITAPVRPVLFGAAPATDYGFERSAAVVDGWFPGLVLEYRRNRVAAERRARGWLSEVLAQVKDYSRADVAATGA